MPDFLFRGNAVILTGASSGIGRALAIELAGQGEAFGQVAHFDDGVLPVYRALRHLATGPQCQVQHAGVAVLLERAVASPSSSVAVKTR